MTAADHAALTAEVAELEGRPPRIAQRIKTAREWGDLKENSEYHDAKNDQAHLETKIAVLRERLARAEVVEVSSVPVGVVSFGSGVHVRDENGREQHFEIVSSNTAAPARARSPRNPRRPRAARHAGRRRGDRHAPSREPPLHGRPARLTGPRTPGGAARLRPPRTPRSCPSPPPGRGYRPPRAPARAAGIGRCPPGVPRCLPASGSGSARSRGNRRRGHPRGR